NDRLNEANDGPPDSHFVAARTRTSRSNEDNLPSPPPLDLGSNMLGIGEARSGDRRANSEVILRKDKTADGDGDGDGDGEADGANALYPSSTALPAASNNSPDPGEAIAREGRQAGLDASRSRSTSGRRAPRAEETSVVESPRSRRRVALT